MGHNCPLRSAASRAHCSPLPSVRRVSLNARFLRHLWGRFNVLARFEIFRKCRFHDGLVRLVGFYDVYSPARIGASIEHSAIGRPMTPLSGSASWP